MNFYLLINQSICMKKFLLSAVATTFLVAALIPAAQAANPVTSQFEVSVLLAAQCIANNSGSQTVDFGTYTAFGAVKTASAVLTFNCTRGLATPTFSFDTANGLANGDGVVAGLNYSLSTVTTTTLGNPATAGTTNGSAAVRTVTISGTMPSGQAGQCLATSPAPGARLVQLPPLLNQAFSSRCALWHGHFALHIDASRTGLSFKRHSGMAVAIP